MRFWLYVDPSTRELKQRVKQTRRSGAGKAELAEQDQQSRSSRAGLAEQDYFNRREKKVKAMAQAAGAAAPPDLPQQRHARVDQIGM